MKNRGKNFEKLEVIMVVSISGTPTDRKIYHCNRDNEWKRVVVVTQDEAARRQPVKPCKLDQTNRAREREISNCWAAGSR